EVVHGREMPVERRRHDSDLPRHLAQAEAGQAAVFQQGERRVQQCLAGALLAFLPCGHHHSHFSYHTGQRTLPVVSARLFTNLLETVASPHGIDRYLELVHPMLTGRELRAEVTAVHRSTSDTVTLTLRPTRRWRGFTAGQFVRVSVDIDGVRRTRCYSPAGSQHRPDGRIELTVKAHTGGLVSSYLHAWARPGLVVGLSQGGGAFTLPAL